jgi:hypothetical protein
MSNTPVFFSLSTEGKTFTAESLSPYKGKGDKHWTVTADLRALETFDNCESNYDVVEKLKANKVLTESADEDSEYCQFFAYFKTKTAAESFVKRLARYVEKRKQILQSL